MGGRVRVALDDGDGDEDGEAVGLIGGSEAVRGVTVHAVNKTAANPVSLEMRICA